MIIVKISGGLGNQLFQYSFGKFLSVCFNTELKFDIKTNSSISGFTNRSFGLNDLNLNINIASSDDIKKFKYFTNNTFLERLERKFVQIFPFINRQYKVQRFNSQMNKGFKDNCYYDGYWQSEKYFKTIEGIVRKDLEFKPSLNSYNLELLNQIVDTESVSLHIRRGDYLTIKANTKIFAVCSVDYYNRAIDFFIGRLKSPKFFIFSDDYEFAKENFKGNQFRIVENSANPETDLYLMSKCKHNIIANSSFSWWGAWLNSNPNKIVISPIEWYNEKLNNITMDLIPSEWIKL